jgi:Fe-S-cluster containining protein
MERNETSFEPLTEGAFRFRCHKGIACFTVCCADLNLVLTPYDVIRLKNRLNIPSDEFLDRYTEMKLGAHGPFPLARLKMAEDEKRHCPFLTPDGCTVYEDRPGACRIYPLGRAAMKVGHTEDTRERFFLVNEPHCLGFQEDKRWTVEEWMSNEGLPVYNAMNDKWLEVVGASKNMGPEENIPKKLKMFYMASYNLDRFREFIFNTRFFDLFDVDTALQEELAVSDERLMFFALDWLKFSLFGEKTLSVRNSSAI